MARVLILDDNMDLGALIAQAFTERGHAVSLHLVGRDALAALQTSSFDAAVIDLHLPDIKGTEVLAACKSSNVPSVAISGVFRGPMFEATLQRDLGVRALLEKPFELERLVAEVEKIFPAPTRPPAPVDVPELVLGEAVDVDAGTSAAEQGAAALAAEREAARKKGLADLPFSGRDAWSGGANARPSTGQMRALASLGSQPKSLAGTSVPRLLGAAHQGRATGELRLRRGQVVKVIWLERGRPVFAASNVAAERFGRHAVARGVLSADDLLAVQELAAREKVRTGEAMVRLGLIAPEQRLELLHDQALQIIASTFEWPDGEHQFIHRSVGKPEVVPLQLGLPEVLHAGFRKMPLVKLRERVPSALVPSPAPDPVFELHELELAAGHERLVMAADGTKTIEDLLALSELEEREALSLLVMLLELRVLEPRAASANRRIVLV